MIIITQTLSLWCVSCFRICMDSLEEQEFSIINLQARYKAYQHFIFFFAHFNLQLDNEEIKNGNQVSSSSINLHHADPFIFSRNFY